MALNVMQAIICASKHRFNVLGQYRQTQYTNHCNKRHGHINNSNNNSQHTSNSAIDICAGPFHIII